MLLRSVAVVVVTLSFSAPSSAAEHEGAASEGAAPTEEGAPASEPFARWGAAAAAAATTAVVSIPVSALGVGGATGICLYTLGLGGLFGVPCAVTPLLCGACGGGAGALVGLWLAGDDLCQPLSIAGGVGVGFLGGALGLLVGGLVTLAAWRPIEERYGQAGDVGSYVDELALIGGAIVAVSTTVTLALASAAVGGLVALLPASPPPAGETVVDQRVRVASDAPWSTPPAARRDGIAY